MGQAAYRLKLPQTLAWHCKHDVFNKKLLKPFIKPSFNMTHQHQLIWLRKKRNRRLKPSLIVAKRDDILSIWSNGKATLMQKTPGNHVEPYTMPKKKWKTFTSNTLTNQNPLLLIITSNRTILDSFKPMFKFTTPSWGP